MTERVTHGAQATRPNQVWTYDFVHDWCANGQRLKILTVVDEFTRESLAIETLTSMKSQAVIEVLKRLHIQLGAPAYLRSDNGAEFTAKQVRDWLADNQIDTLYIEPGSPWQNAFDESFNGRLRDECLNAEWFGNPREAKVVIESWRRHYNEERPHSSLKYQTPTSVPSGVSAKPQQLCTTENLTFQVVLNMGAGQTRVFLLMLLAYRHARCVLELIDTPFKDLDLDSGRLSVRQQQGSLSTPPTD